MFLDYLLIVVKMLTVSSVEAWTIVQQSRLNFKCYRTIWNWKL